MTMKQPVRLSEVRYVRQLRQAHVALHVYEDYQAYFRLKNLAMENFVRAEPGLKQLQSEVGK